MRSLPSDERDYERWAGLDGPTDEELEARDEQIEREIERRKEARDTER